MRGDRARTLYFPPGAVPIRLCHVVGGRRVRLVFAVAIGVAFQIRAVVCVGERASLIWIAEVLKASRQTLRVCLDVAVRLGSRVDRASVTALELQKVLGLGVSRATPLWTHLAVMKEQFWNLPHISGSATE